MSDICALLNAVETGKMTFVDVIAFIDDNYHYTPTAFTNGQISNTAHDNQGSAKVFGLAKQHGLNQIDTLKLFGEHYHSVLNNPNGIDHANIRNFLRYGWQGFSMPKTPLSPKVAVSQKTISKKNG